MFIISCSLLALLPVAFLSVTEYENGTTPYEASLLGNVTINMAENEIDSSHEAVTENAVVYEARTMTTVTAKPAPTITLPQPSDKASVWGPFFEDGTDPHNVTAKLGTTAELDCKIGLLYDKTVSWIRRKGDTMQLLTVGRHTHSVDQRIALHFRYPNNWKLKITSITKRDDGMYECQVATYPPTVKKFFLRVRAPDVKILDEHGQDKERDRFYRVGSTVRLTCVGKKAEEYPPDLIWSRGELLKEGFTTNFSEGVVISTLKISQAQTHHSGTYSCTVDHLVTQSITLHILNGEFPAAIHGGCPNTTVSRLITICLVTLCSLMVTNYSLPRR